MTELIWEGKYDKDGRKVAPLRIALPFQTVETINESMQKPNNPGYNRPGIYLIGDWR